MTVFSTRYFYSRPRVGGDPSASAECTLCLNFYSRPRVGGDFPAQPNYPFLCHNFYSRPRMGGDLADGEGQNSYSIFLLTPPRGGRPETIEEIVNRELISTHAPHGG